MGNVWTVARHTLSESIRQKVAVLLLVILGGIVGLLPFATKGDNSLSGAVQSFLSYAVMVTSFLLCCVSVFLARTISSDLTGKQILVLMTKPVARWQYVVGKWLGIVLLNTGVLALVGVFIYGMTMFIAGRPRGLWVVGTVIALLALLAAVVLVRRLAPQRFSVFGWLVAGGSALVVLVAAGAAVYAMQGYQGTVAPRDAHDAERLNNQVLQARHTAHLQMPMEVFSREAQRLLDQNIEQGKYANIEHFIEEAEKRRLREDIITRWRLLLPTEARELNFEDIRTSRSPDETIHIVYRERVFQYPADEILRCYWIVGDRRKGATEYRIPRRDVVNRQHTMAVPADAVAPDNTLRAVFVNANPWVAAGEMQHGNSVMLEGEDPVKVLFSVGSFGANLARALALVLMRVAFLAAVAVMLTTFLSFPVACLGAFCAYSFMTLRSFLEDAIGWLPGEGAVGVYQIVAGYFLDVVYFLLPSFSTYDGLENLVNGQNVTLMWVLQGLGNLFVLRTGILLLIACLVFQRRQVSEISA